MMPAPSSEGGPGKHNRVAADAAGVVGAAAVGWPAAAAESGQQSGNLLEPDVVEFHWQRGAPWLTM